MRRIEIKALIFNLLALAMLNLFYMNGWSLAVLCVASALLGLYGASEVIQHRLRRRAADAIDLSCIHMLREQAVLHHFTQWPRDTGGRIVVPQLKEGENEIPERAEGPP